MKTLGAPNVGEIWLQFANVETENWQEMKADATLKVSLTDHDGAFEEAISMSKEMFTKYYRPVPENDSLFQRTFKITSILPEESAAWVIHLDSLSQPLGLDEQRMSLRIIEANFQPAD
ncbi:MAG: hypothetical protein GF365_03180 [Candidatus Buchananbacteria bacterium]|nr:hypothetical protein [Candidatus Buchananbacteria bacterium]